jgi:hypothetical protein
LEQILIIGGVTTSKNFRPIIAKIAGLPTFFLPKLPLAEQSLAVIDVFL